jgi:YVTN family beta-propeller protein
VLVGCGSSSVSSSKSGPKGKLYIPNQADQTISILNTADLTVVKTFATPVVEPHFVEFSPDGEYYYIVGRQVGGTMAKYKATNDSLVAQVTVEGVVFPTSFTISPGNDTLYLTDFTLGPGHTHRYNVAGDNFIWLDSILQAGHQTHDITISPDGKYVVSAGFSSDDITVLNTLTGDVTPLTLDSAKQQFNGVSNIYGAYGVEIDHNSRFAILACRKGVDQIRMIDLVNMTILDSILSPVTNATNPNTDGPNYMALSPDNNILFVTNLTDNSLTVYRLSTREVMAHIPFETPKAFGIDISDDGTQVYVSCTNVRPAVGRVYVIDANTFEKIDSVTVGSEPFGLAWQPE